MDVRNGSLPVFTVRTGTGGKPTLRRSSPDRKNGVVSGGHGFDHFAMIKSRKRREIVDHGLFARRSLREGAFQLAAAVEQQPPNICSPRPAVVRLDGDAEKIAFGDRFALTGFITDADSVILDRDHPLALWRKGPTLLLEPVKHALTPTKGEQAIHVGERQNMRGSMSFGPPCPNCGTRVPFPSNTMGTGQAIHLRRLWRIAGDPTHLPRPCLSHRVLAGSGAAGSAARRHAPGRACTGQTAPGCTDRLIAVTSGATAAGVASSGLPASDP